MDKSLDLGFQKSYFKKYLPVGKAGLPTDKVGLEIQKIILFYRKIIPNLLEKACPVRSSISNWVKRAAKRAKIKLTKRNIKGFIKNPLFCLGCLCLFLFLSVLFCPNFLWKNLASGDYSQGPNTKLLAGAFSAVTPKSENDQLFASQQNYLKPETMDFSKINSNTFIAILSPSLLYPYTLADLTDDISFGRKEIIEYTAGKGDTVKSIAAKFNISVNTILWANDLNSSSTVRTGQTIIILPVSGVVYHVKKGDTIDDIAAKYKGKVSDILAFNELANEQDIYVGDILIIPNGAMPQKSAPVPNLIPLANSYFICPISSCRRTQGLHWYNAIDFSDGQCGSPIYAAAAGQILWMKYGYNLGAGNTMAIQHPNGIITTYGHLLSAAVNPGDQVSQGQIIAYMGGTPGVLGSGRSTGCHVHFAVKGARNPFAK